MKKGIQFNYPMPRTFRNPAALFAVLRTCQANLIIEIAMPILDITGHPSVSKSSVYQDLEMYLTIQDSFCISNNQDARPAVGQSCPLCKKGTLSALPGERTESSVNHSLTSENFECDTCHKVFKYYLSVSRDTVGVRG